MEKRTLKINLMLHLDLEYAGDLDEDAVAESVSEMIEGLMADSDIALFSQNLNTLQVKPEKPARIKTAKVTKVS